MTTMIDKTEAVITHLRADGGPWRNFHGRRKGRPLGGGQIDRLEERLRALEPPGISWEENPERRPLDPARLWKGRELWLEIGFGSGEHMLAMARREPHVQMIGADLYLNGVARLLAAIEAAGVSNVSVTGRDARDLMDVLPEASVARIFLLYPDPWPKRRHRKRRFINRPQLDQLARIMRPGAELRIATDIPAYVRHVLEIMAGDPRFAWTAETASDWRKPWEHWPGTRYEAKALREGRVPCYLIFRRL